MRPGCLPRHRARRVFRGTRASHGRIRAIVSIKSACLTYCLGSLLVASLATPAAAQPADVVHLFNGKDLSSFYTWLVNDHHADPDKVFSVVDNVDGAPAIRISGQKFGGITTHEEYETYRLVVEFRWGTVTWNPRASRARDSGVLIHCQGADGNTGKTFNGPWMRSIEAQIIEGGVGDFLMVQGYEADGTRLSTEMTAPHVLDRDGEFVFDANGAARVFRRHSVLDVVRDQAFEMKRDLRVDVLANVRAPETEIAAPAAVR